MKEITMGSLFDGSGGFPLAGKINGIVIRTHHRQILSDVVYRSTLGKENSIYQAGLFIATPKSKNI